MSVDEAISKYRLFGEEIFGNSRRKFSILGWPHNKHDERNLEQVLKQVTLQRTPENGSREFGKFRSPEDLCRT